MHARHQSDESSSPTHVKKTEWGRKARSRTRPLGSTEAVAGWRLASGLAGDQIGVGGGELRANESLAAKHFRELELISASTPHGEKTPRDPNKIRTTGLAIFIDVEAPALPSRAVAGKD